MNYMTVRRPKNGIATRNTGMTDFDRLFESVFDSFPRWSDFKPAVDVRSTDDAYIVDADLPGFDESQIDVRIENDLLVISAKDQSDEQSSEDEKGQEQYMVRERHMRSFYRSFALPKDADAGSIEATYRNGVLSLTIAKKAEAKPRQIQIKRG